MFKQISARLSLEVYDRIAAIRENQNHETIRHTIEFLLEYYENSWGKTPVNTDNTALIAQLQNEIETLKKQVIEAGQTISELENREPEPAPTPPPAENTTKPHHYTIPIHPATKHIADQTAAVVSKKTGKKATFGSVIVGLFEKYVVEGPGDHLPILFSRSEISRITTMYNQEAAKTDEQ